MSIQTADEIITAEPTPRSAHSFTEAQSVASRRIGFTVTKACPLRCAHCSVEASPQLGDTTFTPEFALHIAAQMGALSNISVRFVDFTGGEPVLAASFVKIVSEAAAKAGMTCGMVTSAHWAKTESSAATFIERFPNVQNWDISTDLYHLPFVSLDTVEIAFRALRAYGRSVTMRIAHHDDLSFEEAQLIDRVHRFAGRRIGFQPIGPVGRGRDLITLTAVEEAELDPSPCATTGLLIDNDGAGAPCCAPISHESRNSPLFVGNAFRDSLCDMVSRWRVQPLIQTIRLWGFRPLERWLVEAGVTGTAFYRRRTCDECVAMLIDPERVHLLDRVASRLEHRISLAIALRRDFNEPWMEMALKEEALQYLAGDTSVWISQE
ncbi:MAG TPA: radical SAM protein [Bryobacteraceae bacterium]|nr:radical SAM protein [Bryobacteraceae bacterium]